jgi:hypothetical protein
MSCLGIVVSPVRQIGWAVHGNEDRAMMADGKVVDDLEQWR